MTDISNDMLIVGSGYEDHLIKHVAEDKAKARKLQLIGFPSLRADMYQENVIRVQRAEESCQRAARTAYDERLAKGVAREQARKDLPLSTYTEAYWKIDLHNLFHFLSLRMDSHAQLEIRSYANVIGNEIVSRWCPIAWESLSDYRLNGMLLTRLDREIIRLVSLGERQAAVQQAEEVGWLSQDEGGLKRNREREELEAKMRQLGLTAPW